MRAALQDQARDPIRSESSGQQAGEEEVLSYLMSEVATVVVKLYKPVKLKQHMPAATPKLSRVTEPVHIIWNENGRLHHFSTPSAMMIFIRIYSVF